MVCVCVYNPSNQLKLYIWGRQLVLEKYLKMKARKTLTACTLHIFMMLHSCNYFASSHFNCHKENVLIQNSCIHIIKRISSSLLGKHTHTQIHLHATIRLRNLWCSVKINDTCTSRALKGLKSPQAICLADFAARNIVVWTE